MRQTKRLRPRTVNGTMNVEVPMGVIEMRVPKALTLNTGLPHRFTSSDLSPKHLSFHGRGAEEGRDSETNQKRMENIKRRRKLKEFVGQMTRYGM